MNGGTFQLDEFPQTCEARTVSLTPEGAGTLVIGQKPSFSSLCWWKVPVGAQHAADLCVIDCSAAEHHVPTQIFVQSAGDAATQPFPSGTLQANLVLVAPTENVLPAQCSTF